MRRHICLFEDDFTCFKNFTFEYLQPLLVLFVLLSLIQKIFNHPTVILEPPLTQIYSSETVTVRCEIQESDGSHWMFIMSSAKLEPPSTSEYRISRATESHSGEYKCCTFTLCGDIITLTVSFLLSHHSPGWGRG
uniref:Immunoglobulin domain-containing protein n=1 Tax=Pundamilia nyererei TaxID=303518 RepID=A0A3B4F6T2_9CICH